MKKQGAAKLSFDTIVASGPNSSMPHAQVTNRKIQCGDFVTMDFGGIVGGYCSDMTRTVAVGNVSDEPAPMPFAARNGSGAWGLPPHLPAK